MALMGALCAPMAYATLKAADQGALAAVLAATMVALGNEVVYCFDQSLGLCSSFDDFSHNFAWHRFTS